MWTLLFAACAVAPIESDSPSGEVVITAPDTEGDTDPDIDSDSETVSGLPVSETASYRLWVHNDWTEEVQGALPVDAHFSWLGGALHDGGLVLFEVGEVATVGMQTMAQWGATDALLDELGPYPGEAELLEWRQWYCPEPVDQPDCAPSGHLLEVTDATPYLSLVSMLGPSPDWFIAVQDLDLRDGEYWADTLMVDLYAYDGGTRADNAWAIGGTATIPPDPITEITAQSGQLVGPERIGRLELVRFDP